MGVEPYKSDEEKERKIREAERKRAEIRYTERKSREEQGLKNLEERFRQLDPDNDD